MPQFDLQLLSPLVFWSIVSFGILLLVLYKYVLPPILDTLDERKKLIEEDIEKGKQLKTDLEAMKVEYQKKLEEAEVKANRKVQEAIREAKSSREEIMRESKREAEAMREKAEQDIMQERKKAMAEIRDQVVSLSIVTATKILRHSVDEDAAKQIADDVIKDLGELS